ncbi:MAG: FliM/FliN family flagellar motor switch protein [Peptococcaceae bacterium]|nr:FliM/FliN family flagellar motor switch protein [Peptococcaceae bacterium]
MTEEEARLLPGASRKSDIEIRKVQFPSLKPLDADNQPPNMTHIDDIYIEVSVELGRGELNVKDLMALEEGSVIKLDRVIGEAVDVNLNRQRFAKGEVIIVNEEFNVRISTVNQVRNLKLSEGLI